MNGRSTGRTVGALMLAQGLMMPVMNFVLFAPGMKEPGLLENARAHAAEMRLGALFALLVGTLGIAIAVVAYRFISRYSPAMAVLGLAMNAIAFVTLAFEANTVLNLVSLSEEYAASGTPAGPYEAMAASARWSRHWAHYTNLIVGSARFIVFSAVLFAFALAPRILAGFCVVASVIQLVAVTMPVLGYALLFQLMTPAAIASLALLGWLLYRGFNEPPRPAAE